MESQYLRMILLVIGGLIILALVWDGLRRRKRLRVPEMETLDESVSSEISDNEEEGIISLPHKKEDPIDAMLSEDYELVPVTRSEKRPVSPVAIAKSEAAKEQYLPQQQRNMQRPRVPQSLLKKDVIKEQEQKRAEEMLQQEEQRAATVTPKAAIEEPKATPVAEKKEAAKFSDDLIVVNIVALKGQRFAGYDLLQTILGNGFRFGQMQLFHRHRDLNGQGPVLFSLASATATGTFDMDNMGGFSCSGLTLFMRLPAPKNGMANLELMLNSARALAEGLGGEVCDAELKTLSSAGIEKYKHALRKSEQGQMALDLS